ncbi:hypothetical protein [Listeria cornellensis]|uniref:Uncharacterized protein n=1 Tax=Listeria cornellensis FSL F6-0969 TaxID=1265820 RepID=W7BJU2_9LIST|nr:hypothetical protein [Listeria cornellensis]EUJ27339.1 hypothetical protein PCORN_13457 [Listeria cornellensis FSL F6-0969]
MIIKSKQIIERIGVFHNDREEMFNTVEKLKKGGYGDNTRCSISGIQLVTYRNLSESDQVKLKDLYPKLIIHHEEPGILSDGYYVFYTEHERIIEGREN